MENDEKTKTYLAKKVNLLLGELAARGILDKQFFDSLKEEMSKDFVLELFNKKKSDKDTPLIDIMRDENGLIMPEATYSEDRTKMIFLENKKYYKTLKRILKDHDMTFDEYKEKWGLPPTYPIDAPIQD
jgi:hypothetical protein